MGRGRGGRGGGRGRGGWGGRGGGGGRGPPRDNRVDKSTISRHNEKFEKYYNQLDLVPEEDKEQLWEAMRRDLPNSFRFTGSRVHALAVQQRLRDFYIPEITSIRYEGELVDPPQPVPWYPNQLAWYMTTPKHIIRRFPPFKSFQSFLVAETDVGNITRQEIVSMIPPLLMDIKPGHTVLDLCAAPGSKSAQIIEMLHDGEEERSRKVAETLASGSSRPEGQDYKDDGRSTGLLIANDVDYKRAHMLVHQVKRLASPNIIVTNHDATIFPSIKVPSLPTADGKPIQNRYLKFDRILADVPCSGDGTARKNLEIWQKWNPSNGLGLHATQVRILVRALQMLKIGGRVVYSTCSMNPVEDEAVLSAAIQRCGGSDFVQLIETKDYLPGLKRFPGLKKWSIMSKAGRIWNSYDEVLKEQEAKGEEALSKLTESMFPPKDDLPLERAIRVYPHLHDTGAFFISILEKKAEIKAKTEEKPAATVKAPAAADSNGTEPVVDTNAEVQIKDEDVKVKAEIPNGSSSPKRKRVEDADNADQADSATKRVKVELQPDPPALPQVDGNSTSKQIDSAPVASVAAPTPTANGNSGANPKRNRNQPFEEPFKYLSPTSTSELTDIRKFYNLSPDFPTDRFMVRNPAATATKNIYYTTALAKDILTENEGKGIKFVHAGVKMFVKQDAPSPETCPWRIQTDGMRIVEMWVGPERIIKLWKKETLRKLLVEMFPRFANDEHKNLGEVGPQILKVGMGCCVLVVEPRADEGDSGFNERMVFPLWKSIQSLNLMLPKEERKAMLLRLFGDSPELINSMQQNPGGKRPEKMKKPDAATEGDKAQDVRMRNSSSPESDAPPPLAAEGVEAEAVDVDDEEDGGVAI
ncbi:Multisite-specific tRNA:(cytosine-C(5))-methyltransferase trm4a [Cyphellophora attinorum]|uniref:Multisite-specific tRNA:(Cytosine-C(5))-methyltransferase trm4a n=1 Tax=Cyphellophora attinorum TaxID=1664694 RepID=A0A0N0NJN5_9EURO|nr:Multisite-specific tRNA:(cytosine-C(5))-methyltransferase trm4a [Phialophora attinorum]KPI37181.1 Multisite-specific tRNA:(cytosine-C(5))-methyltransferase trm4a [Phialophora attinorum]